MNIRHGRSKHRLYKLWANIKYRCYNEKCSKYKWYGAKGIRMCDEWLTDSQLFIDWGLANGWQEGLLIDRIDFDKNYSPENCRFITAAISTCNRSSNKYVIWKGERKQMLELYAELNPPISARLFRARLNDGWDIEKAATTPHRRANTKNSPRQSGRVFSL